MPARHKVSSRFLRNSCSELRMNNKTGHESNNHGRRRNKAESQCSVRDAASGLHDTAMDDVQTALIDLTSAARTQKGEISQPGPRTRYLQQPKTLSNRRINPDLSTQAIVGTNSSIHWFPERQR